MSRLFFASIIGFINLGIILAFAILGIYALILTIKALKIYIKNNENKGL